MGFSSSRYNCFFPRPSAKCDAVNHTGLGEDTGSPRKGVMGHSCAAGIWGPDQPALGGTCPLPSVSAFKPPPSSTRESERGFSQEPMCRVG